VVQARSWLPDAVGGVIWFGPGAAHGTVYIPVLAGMQLAPDTLEYGWQGVYNTTTAFWANRRVLNYAQVKFSYMIEQIRALQAALESASVRLIGELSDRYALSAAHPVALTTTELASIESVFVANAWKATAEMNRLFHFLFFSYPDGYLDYWDEAGFHSGSLGYPVWWLEAGNYVDGPPPVTASAMQQQVRQRAQEALKQEQKRAEAAVGTRRGAEGVPGVSTAGKLDMMQMLVEGQAQAASADSALVQCLQGCDLHSSDRTYRECTQACISHSQ
jgi:hypothetical protein